MAWWGWLLIVLVILLAATVYGAFRVAEVRAKPRTPKNLEEDRTWGPFTEQVKAAQAMVVAMPREDVEMTSYDGLKLRGSFYPCENARGTVVLMHGFRSAGLRDFGTQLPFYASLGLNILLPDQRSHGRSEGRYICYGVKERRDCLDWLHWVNQREGADKPLLLGGISMGGATVLMTLGLDTPANLKGCVADCAYTSPWEILRHVGQGRYHAPVEPLLYLCDGVSRLAAGWGYKEASPVEAVKHAKVPVLFIHGGTDDFVPTEMSQVNYDACVSEKKLVIVPGAKHATSYLTDTERYEREVRAFVERVMGGKKA